MDNIDLSKFLDNYEDYDGMLDEIPPLMGDDGVVDYD